jgi:hypothetical protein
MRAWGGEPCVEVVTAAWRKVAYHEGVGAACVRGVQAGWLFLILMV